MSMNVWWLSYSSIQLVLKASSCFLQIYSQFVEVSDLLQQERDENARLKQYLDQIMNVITEYNTLGLKTNEIKSNLNQLEKGF